MKESINRLKDLELYMNPYTGSIDTGENWEADRERAIASDFLDLGWAKDWRDSMVHVDTNGQEIE